MEQRPMPQVAESKPNPDPTFATIALLTREIECLRDIMFTRLDAQDKATVLQVEVLSSALNAAHDLTEAKFQAVSAQFLAIDVLRKESATATATAVAAALQAAKEAVGEQTKTFTAQIDKSEASTTKNADAQADTLKTSLSALTVQLTDLKDRVTRTEGQSTGQDKMGGWIAGGIGLLIGVAGIIIGLR